MIYQIKDLINRLFIPLEYKNYFMGYTGKICIVRLNPKNNVYELTTIDDPTRCYQVRLQQKVKCYTTETHPEYFL